MNSRQNFNAMRKLWHYGRPLSVVRISVLPEVSQMGYRDRVVPYRLWRFCATSERPRRSKTKWVIITISLSVTHIYIYRYIYILYIIFRPGRMCCPGKCVLTAQGQCFVRFPVPFVWANGWRFVSLISSTSSSSSAAASSSTTSTSSTSTTLVDLPNWM